MCLDDNRSAEYAALMMIGEHEALLQSRQRPPLDELLRPWILLFVKITLQQSKHKLGRHDVLPSAIVAMKIYLASSPPVAASSPN